MVSIGRMLRSASFSLVATVVLLMIPGVVGIDTTSMPVEEAVTVSVTLPVTIPFQVPPGKNFQEASVEFCRKNGLPEENIEPLTKALFKKWDEMKSAKAQVLSRCMQWKNDYNVVPLNSWGTLPQAFRRDWIQLDCDSLVPVYKPTPLVRISVLVAGRDTSLDFFEGDSIEGSVTRFCKENIVDIQQSGAILEQALTEALQKRAQKFGVEPEVKESRGIYLFSIPVSINGTVVRLKVHDGDKMDPLVSGFCEEHGISYEKYGGALSEEIIKSLTDLQDHLLNKQKQEEAREEQARLKQQEDMKQKSKLLSLPLQIDGRNTTIDVYDGDELRSKVSEFCEANGIDTTAHGQNLFDAVMEEVRAIQQLDSSFIRIES